MSARMIMLCLDGADGRMLDQYSADGSLPNLSALRARGSARPLSAPLGSTDDALWASFQYTRELGEHGRYSYLMPQTDSRLAMAHETEQQPTFWDELSDQGLRVAILDVPKCRAPWPLNGIQILDWLTHDTWRILPVPEELSAVADR
jgi:predicted AlkP superfamily phosphohydrolase/phosphomutase